MSDTPRRAGWWRWPAPSVLVFTLLIGVFPWIEIGCRGKPQDFEEIATKLRQPLGANGKVVLQTQTGYQALWGGSSPGPEIRELRRKMEESKQSSPAPAVQVVPNNDRAESAPLVWVYFVLVLAAVAIGFALPPGLWRSGIFLGTAGVAALLFAVQAAIGLPIKNNADDPKKNSATALPGAPGLKWKGNGSGPQPYSRYTLWYYLNWPFLLLPLALVGVEEGIALARPVRRRRPRYQEEDEEEPVPRQRRRDPDEDQERPRRRRYPHSRNR
jgi:hypothetical protein